MDGTPILFQDLLLIDDREAYSPVVSHIDAILQVKAFAPSRDDPSLYDAGLLEFNLYLRNASFTDTASTLRKPWPHKMIPMFVVIILLCFIVNLFYFIIWLTADAVSAGEYDFGLLIGGVVVTLVSMAAIVGLAMLSSRLYPKRIEATVSVAPELMDALCERHARFNEAKRAIEQAGTSPTTLKQSVGANLTGTAVENAVGALLPAGLGTLAGLAAESAAGGQSVTEWLEAQRRGEKASQIAMVLAHHRTLTGRGGAKMARDDFLATQTTSQAELQQRSEHED